MAAVTAVLHVVPVTGQQVLGGGRVPHRAARVDAEPVRRHTYTNTNREASMYYRVVCVFKIKIRKQLVPMFLLCMFHVSELTLQGLHECSLGKYLASAAFRHHAESMRLIHVAYTTEGSA